MWQCVLVVFHVAVSILVMFCEAVPCLCDCFRHVLCGGVMCMFLSCLICLLSFNPVVSVVSVSCVWLCFSNVSWGCICFNHVSCFGYLLHSCVMSQLHFMIRYNKQNYVAHIVTFDGVFSSV